MIPISSEQSHSQFLNTFDSKTNNTTSGADISDAASSFRPKNNLNQMNAYGHLLVNENDFTSKNANELNKFGMLNQASTAINHNDELINEFDDDYDDDNDSQSDEIDDQTYNITGRIYLKFSFIIT